MRRRKLFAAAAVLIVALLASPRPVSAHARVVASEPARRAALVRPPAAIRVWFNEALEPKFARLTVTDAAGRAFEAGAVTVSPDDPKLLILALPPLPAGAYTVSYDVLSVDGHRVKQSFPFSVKPAEPPR